MKKLKEVHSFTLSASSVKWLRRKAKENGDTVSAFMEKMIQKKIETEETQK